MEQQVTSAPSQPPTNRRDTLPARFSSPTTSSPAPKSAPSLPSPPPQTSLSTSEPTLRFPRPLGNRRLAHWVSSSNPDIMRMTTTTEDTGLSESTYELVSGTNTDTESQDGNYTESMSESISSLDFHRPDDAHSLAGTEQTYDDESVVDDSEVYRPTTPDHEEDNNEMHENIILAESQTTNDPGVESLSDSEHEACSRSSLEYTYQSLGTPSLPTPEASRIVVKPVVQQPQQSESEPVQMNWKKRVARFWEIYDRVRDYVAEASSAALPGIIFVVAIALVIPVPYNPSTLPPSATMPDQSSAMPIAATSTTACTISSSQSIPCSSSSPSFTGGMGLIPIGDAPSDEWIFGAKKPVISFTAQADSNILIHIPRNIKKTWLAKHCLTVAAKRGDDHVNTTMSSVDEGILLKFAKKEVHGVVSLVLEAKCRPKVHKVIKVHFGRGIMEEAYERTKHLAHDLSELVPAAAQEAERCIEGAKRSLGSACHNVCQSIQLASETMAKNLDTAFSVSCQSLENLVSGIRGVTEKIAHKLDDAANRGTKLQDLQSHLQLQLLETQISARVWWLQFTGQQKKRDDYHRKAKIFLDKKQTAAKEASRERRKRYEQHIEWASRLWSRAAGA